LIELAKASFIFLVFLGIFCCILCEKDVSLPPGDCAKAAVRRGRRQFKRARRRGTMTSLTAYGVDYKKVTQHARNVWV
jgi:hypothetical protein